MSKARAQLSANAPPAPPCQIATAWDDLEDAWCGGNASGMNGLALGAVGMTVRRAGAAMAKQREGARAQATHTRTQRHYFVASDECHKLVPFRNRICKSPLQPARSLA